MVDVLFVTVIIAFFAIALALVKACDRIIGPDIVLSDRVGDDLTADKRESGPTPSEVLAS